MKDKWTDSIRERMDSYEEPVPEGLWSSIETSVLDRKKPAGRAILPWIWGMAAAAAVAVGVFLGVRLTDKDRTEEILVRQESRTPSASKPSSSVDITGSPAPSADLVAEARGPVRVKKDLRTVPALDDAERGAVAEESLEETPEIPEESPEKAPEQAPEVYKGPGNGQLDPQVLEGWLDSPVKLKRRVNIRRPSSAGLSFSGSSANSNQSNTVESSAFFYGMPSSVINPDQSAPMTRAISEPVTKDEKHRRPIRASLSLSYPFSDRLALETGLTFSVLYSTFTTTSGETVSEDSQKLTYLGIPLNLRMDIMAKDRLSFYALGGGTVEKSLSATSKTRTKVAGVRTGNSDSRHLSVNSFTWSLNAAAGFQYQATDLIGIYFEPGLSYHFDNNSKVRTVYTEHPLDFVLNFGLRFSFR